VIHRVCLSTGTVIGYDFHSYLIQTASVNSCLFSAYPLALTGKADSQEDALFSIAPFMSCCDSGVISPKSSSRIFLHLRKRNVQKAIVTHKREASDGQQHWSIYWA